MQKTGKERAKKSAQKRQKRRAKWSKNEAIGEAETGNFRPPAESFFD
jgi:hypothetical protein